jgi:hypothetical protein
MKVGVSITGNVERLGAAALAQVAARLQQAAEDATWRRRAARADAATLPLADGPRASGTAGAQGE